MINKCKQQELDLHAEGKHVFPVILSMNDKKRTSLAIRTGMLQETNAVLPKSWILSKLLGFFYPDDLDLDFTHQFFLFCL